MELRVRKKSQQKLKLVQRISKMNCMNYDHKKYLGYLNFSRAIEKGYIRKLTRRLYETLI